MFFLINFVYDVHEFCILKSYFCVKSNKLKCSIMRKESKPFLKLVAEDLKLHDDMENSLLVFPNRRAILFFNECWAGDFDNPVFALESTTIQDLFHTLSPYSVPDEITLLIELFASIKETHPEILGVDPTFDKFYYWGQTLLSDFDDIDKNCVNAQALFSNVADLQHVKDFSFLTESQVKVLEHFFSTFSIDAQNEKIQLFAKLWENLYSIYLAFKERLSKKQLAYEGMLMLDVIEKLKSGEIDDSKYERLVFIGFNVLSRTEYAFFKRYRDSKRADFYWDYDLYYSAPESIQEAGLFMRQNIIDFPSSLKEPSLFDNYSKSKKITFVSTSSDNAQAGYVAKFLEDTSNIVVDEIAGENEKIDRRTAIVLCDETLLLPVLHSIPTDKDLALNVTMGFPVSQTPISSLILALANYHVYLDERKPKTVALSLIEPIVNHAYIKEVFPEVTEKVDQMKIERNVFPQISEFENGDENLSLILKPAVDSTDLIERMKKIVVKISTHESQYSLYSDLYNESLFRVYNTLVRFADEICSEELAMSVGLTCQLLMKVIAQTKVPFHGEPIEGLQVMGFLETRGLDFSHICLLSASNKQLPPSAEISSFIPLSIRSGFEMTSVEQKNALFAYYFYRLIQRADDVTLVYNSSCDIQTTDGQMSRYMLQMLVENKNFEIKKYDIENVVPSITTESWSVKNSDEIVKKLLERFSTDSERPLSPSAINLYFECPLKFYFKYALGLKEPDQDDDGISSTDMGTIFHAVMEEIYADLVKKKGTSISASDLKLLKKDDIYSIIDHFINIHYYKIDKYKTLPRTVSQFHGHLLVARDLLQEFVRKQLIIDSKLNDLNYLASEEKVVVPIEIDVNGTKQQIYVGGVVDRQDSVNGGKRRIVDYKTGGDVPSSMKDLDDLFAYTNRKKVHYQLQILIYSSLIHKAKGVDVTPVLNFVNQKTEDVECVLSVQKEVVGDKGKPKKVDETIVVNNEFCDEFDNKLKTALSDIFNANKNFTQTEEPEKFCDFCAFLQICRKRKE